MAESKGDNLISNLSWKFAERITAQIVTTVVSIILARLLEPTHYGVVSIVIIFITFANVLVSDGFGSALIQKRDADALDFSSVLYFNIVFSIALYLILFWAAPYIAAFYGEGYEILTPVFRVLGIRIIIAGINSVQQAYVSRNMIFKKFFWATLFGTVMSAIVGISLAYAGFGVWALVAQYLTNTTVDTIVLNRTLKIKPILKFSFSRLREMLGYGINILGTSILITGYEEIRSLIIGKVYSSSDLAFYEKGRQFPRLLINNINTSIGAVLFPKMSKEQNDRDKLKETTRNSIRFSSYFLSPLMIGLAAVAEPFVKILLTEKWLPCVPLLRLFCITYLFHPVHTANMQAIKSVGEGSTYLKLEVFKKVIELAALLIVMQISVNAIVVSMAVLATLFTFVNAYPNRKLIGYSYMEQVKDIVPNVSMALIMGIGVLFVGKLNMPSLPLLVIQVLSGGVIYFGLSVFTRNRQLKFVLRMIKEHINRK